MFDGAGTALGFLLTPEGILLIMIGTFIGTIAALIPGVSPVTMMALLLPVTFGMERYDAFMFFVSLMAAGGFAGAITSILINVPGDGINAATCLDGYPMARQGRAGVAIGAAAAASALGALIGLGILVLSIPIVRQVILAFSPPEFFALAIAGIALVATVSARSPLRGLAAALFGMSLGFIGLSLSVGTERYTFDQIFLADGVALIPAVIGLFALPELFELLRRNEPIARTGTLVKGGVTEGIREVLRRPGLLIKSSVLGSVIGTLPGVGGSVASWVAYFNAQRASKSPETFGKGNIEGVIAPESAVDAKEGGSMLPVLALGIPGSVSTAILLSLFQLQGVFPGQRLFANDMPLVWVMILAMVASNILTSVWGLMFANQVVRVTLLPAIILAPVIFVYGSIGSYTDQRSLYGLVFMLFFGFLGWIMVRLDYPRPPLLIGFLLMPVAETNYLISTGMARGTLDWLFRPLTMIILLSVVVVFVIPPLVRVIGRRRGGQGLRLELVDEESSDLGAIKAGPPPLAHLAFAAALLAFAVLFIVEGLNYRAQARIFPMIVLIPLTVFALVLIAKTALAWFRERGRPRPPAEVTARPMWYVALWALILPAMIVVLGVLPAIGIYTAGFILLFEFRRPSPKLVAGAVIGGIVIAISNHLIFTEWLGMRFDPGWLSDVLGL